MEKPEEFIDTYETLYEEITVNDLLASYGPRAKISSYDSINIEYKLRDPDYDRKYEEWKTYRIHELEGELEALRTS